MSQAAASASSRDLDSAAEWRTVAEVAHAIGIAPQVVSKYERNGLRRRAPQERELR